MLRLTFAQMRRSIGRLTAAGIAIAIGSAFIVVTLLAGNVITRTTYDAISASYAQADVVIQHDPENYYGGAEDQALTKEKLADINAVPGVDAVLPAADSYQMLEGPARSEFQLIIPTSADSRLNPLVAAQGHLPEADDQLAMPTDQAERLGAGIGDIVTVSMPEYVELGPDATAEEIEAAADPKMLVESFTVVGLLDDPNGAYAMDGGASMATVGGLENLQRLYDISGIEIEYWDATIALAPGTDRDATIDAISGILNNDQLLVQTRDDAAATSAANFTGGEDILTNVVLAFAALSLLVAGLVIANTFQVLVAQRTHTLAMLRCIGANKRQLRMSVRVEAAVLGLASAVVGIVLGCLLGQGTLTVLGNMDLGVPLPTMITLSPVVFWLPILASLLVTMISAMAPASAATRVSPLAALRPAEAPSVRGGGLVRLIVSILLTLGGFVLLGLGIAWSTGSTPDFALLVGILGGALSFIGIVVGAVFWLPKVIGLVGWGLTKTGPTGKLAAANIVRNPRRTAATSTALLIGVTLVVMMSTAAISARQTLNDGLDDTFPIDVQASSSMIYDGALGAVGPEVRAEVAAIDGVGLVVPLQYDEVEVLDGQLTDVYAIDPQQGAEVARDSQLLNGLNNSTFLINAAWADHLKIKEGDTVTFTPGEATTAVNAQEVALTAVVADPPGTVFITPETMAKLNPTAPTTDLWIKLADDADAYTAAMDVQDVFADTEVWVTGAAIERAMFEQVIDVLLAVVLGLLAVAVIIALIGVANTLSLSVIERRRENAMLRAIGLSRRQLRGTLAIEGILIATVGTILGAILGLIYGWAGSLTLLSASTETVKLAVPWTELVVVLAVALVAGLLASVLPARRAVRTSPVEALAND